MKVYLFDVLTGVYRGEDFLDSSEVTVVDGATCIPPPAYENGLIPIFDTHNLTWSLVLLSNLRERICHE